VAQLVVVDEVLVPGCAAGHPLRHHRRDVSLEPTIIEAGGEPLDQTNRSTGRASSSAHRRSRLRSLLDRLAISAQSFRTWGASKFSRGVWGQDRAASFQLSRRDL
jgi:hypothetical protein